VRSTSGRQPSALAASEEFIIPAMSRTLILTRLPSRLRGVSTKWPI
jgi:hypothetical protein